MLETASRNATFADLAALPDDGRHELLAGEIVARTGGSGEHGNTHAALAALLRSRDDSGARALAGAWWIAMSVDVELSPHDVVCPDLVGFRRGAGVARPSGRPVRMRPAFIAEVVSEDDRGRDAVTKLRLYHRARIPHYWLVDPARETLHVLRWSDAGYLVALAAARGETVRAEPFEDVELPLARLFGD